MPSGAKKRKAAKKKKEKQSHVHSSTDNQHHSGADQVKSQDEQDSDGAETGSPISQDQNPFTVEIEDTEKKEPSDVQSLDGKSKYVEQVSSPDIQEKRGQANEEVVEVVSLVEFNEGSESKDVDVEHDKSAKELYNRSAKSNDYESQVAEKILEEEHVAAIPVLEINPSVMSDSISKEVTSVTEECIEGSQVAEKRSKEENVAAISVSGTAPVDVSVKSIDLMSKEVTDVTEKAPVGEASGSVLVASRIVDSAAKQVDSPSKEVVCVEERAPVEDSYVSGSNEIKSKETEANMLPSLNEVSRESSALRSENNVFPLSYGPSSTAISTKENETVLSSTAPQAETMNEDDDRESDIPEHSKNQSFVSSIPPQTVQRTSWLSCCGILDVFSDTGR